MAMNGGASLKSKPFKVLVADLIHSSGIELLKEFADVTINTKHTEEEMCKLVKNFDGLIVRSSTTVTSKIIESAPNLRIIGRAGVGVDNIDLDAATRAGIYVVCSPLGNTIAAAEHTLALILSLSRNIAPADASIRSGKWERVTFMGVQLQHKKLGVIGLGQVGGHVANVAKTLQMEVLVYDPFINQRKCDSLGFKLCQMDELLAEADYITLHIPLNDKTRNLICKDSINKMKKGARVINASRGGVVNEADLCEALESGQLGGAALDVFEKEAKFPDDSPLLRAPNLLLTPHLGASTFEAQVNVALDVCQQIQCLFHGRIPESAVNIPGISAKELYKNYTHIRWGEKLGKISAQLLKGPLENISVSLNGKLSTENGEPYLLSVTHGVLSYFSSTRVNYVNIKQKVKENKINLKLESDEFSNIDGVKVVLSNKENSASLIGNVVDQNKFVLNEFLSTPIYLTINDHTPYQPIYLFYSKHRDLPGILGSIASTIGNFGVNINDCHLGRTLHENENCGVCVFFMDKPIDPTHMESLQTKEYVFECSQCII